MSIKRKIKKNIYKLEEACESGDIKVINIPFKTELIKRFYEFYISDCNEDHLELEDILYEIDESKNEYVVLNSYKVKNDFEEIEEYRKESFYLSKIDVSIEMLYCERSSVNVIFLELIPESLNYRKFKNFLIKLLEDSLPILDDNKYFTFKLES